jgi:hypothetical protein
MDIELNCPECGSDRVTVTVEQTLMVNTLEHYCHSVKAQDDEARSMCLSCRWTGHRGALLENRKQPNNEAMRHAAKEER